MKLIKKDSYEPESLLDFIMDFAALTLSIFVCMFLAGLIVGLADIVTDGWLVSVEKHSGSYLVGFIAAMFSLPLNNWINSKIYKRQQKEKGE